MIRKSNQAVALTHPNADTFETAMLRLPSYFKTGAGGWIIRSYAAHPSGRRHSRRSSCFAGSRTRRWLSPTPTQTLSRLRCYDYLLTSKLVQGGGFEPPKLARQIYSLIPLATREPLRDFFLHLYMKLIWSWREELNPRPADYKSAALPTELHQLFST